MTWAFSGLLSMNPWGFLEGRRNDDAQARLQGTAPSWSEVRNSLDAVIRNHSYSTETVRKLLKPDSLGPGMTPIGTLADFGLVALGEL